jgi:hypothetical protein
MNKKIIAAIILLAIVLVAVVTCPGKQAHQDAVIAEMNSAIKHALNDNDSTEQEKSDLEKGFAALGTMFVQKALEATLESNLELNNYFLFSTSSIETGKEKQTLSIGVFGHIFTTFDRENVKEKLDEAMSKL